MKLVLTIFITLSFSTIARSQLVTGSATTQGACSPANTGSNNTFVINCGIDKAEGQRLLAIMNKILANQLNTDDVMAKLDEILRKIRTPRRLSEPQKHEIAACLSKKPGWFSIGSIENNTEAYTYAQDWREVFIAAGWNIEHKDVPIQVFSIGGGMWSGLHFGIHDASPGQGLMALADDSPELNLAQCLRSRTDIPGGGQLMPNRNTHVGSVYVQVSEQPHQ